MQVIIKHCKYLSKKLVDIFYIESHVRRDSSLRNAKQSIYTKFKFKLALHFSELAIKPLKSCFKIISATKQTNSLLDALPPV